ncbi:argininosuccinate lyase [Paenibacillus sp. 481]|uniref:argininosuccinate lyase n=1 Tax=Paenibacillus sp. 481 TaxID=2835869 RepID=UPI001E5B3980|nr:argininosuccinate lyase [Paenibacillus sp. 481]UHA74241.1 argininosuccinate lyase [Paenibacillus sp. 481]
MTNEEQVELEGDRFPGRTYAEVVLAPAYVQAQAELLEPMMAINRAQLVMLHEQRLITEADARCIARGLMLLDTQSLRKEPYTGQFEDLFFHVEHALSEFVGDAAYHLHIGRSRNDMGIAMYRMVLREKVTSTLRAALFVQRRLIDFAKQHTDTIMLGYTHTQQAQPTTMAHYVAAVIDSLERDIVRLRAAFANCNRSSMGAAALTTSGFALNRERMAELLGFDGIIENAYDAVSGADYVGEVATAVQLAALNLGRFVQELLLWCTQEFAAIRVADPYVQVSSIMPQKRNPVSIEHMRSLLSRCAGNAQTVLTMLHNTPFGDIVDTEDDMQPYAWKCLSTLEQVYRLLGWVVSSLTVNREKLLARAESSFATVTELADTIVRKEGLSFRTAHTIVSRVVQQAARSDGHAPQGANSGEHVDGQVQHITIRLLNEAAQDLIGRPLALSEAEVIEALQPARFIAVRALIGGPNKDEMTRALAEQTTRLANSERWLNETQNQFVQALEAGRQLVGKWAE